MATKKDYVESLASDTKVDKFCNIPSPDKIGMTKIPESMDEARAYLNFWNGVVSEFKDDVSKIRFHYQENDKELPLSLGKKILKSVGFGVKPKTEEGEIKYEELNPEYVRGINKGLVSLITNEDQWKILNATSKNTGSFSAPHVYLLGNLCNQVNIPLECINDVNFNSPDFLSKEYEVPMEDQK